jgi:hypothetical protein|tara:strand:+ start:182 stop:493 length:312 start_codon:yes stop_codon:yes gene_type:complete
MNDDSLVSLGMGLEELLKALLKTSFPKGDLKRDMFAMHNSLVGRSKIIKKSENVNTMCGSCIMRVRGNLFKYYHHEYEPKFDSLFFQDKYVLDKHPVYGIKKK